jgi:hypothetical protein
VPVVPRKVVDRFGVRGSTEGDNQHVKHFVFS